MERIKLRSWLLRGGSLQEIDIDTGEVIPCAPDVCQECGADHAHDHPHNQESFYYGYRFYERHNRWPTWSDAMAHCTDEVKALWRRVTIEVMRQNGVEVPEDLLDPKPVGR